LLLEGDIPDVVAEKAGSSILRVDKKKSAAPMEGIQLVYGKVSFRERCSRKNRSI